MTISCNAADRANFHSGTMQLSGIPIALPAEEVGNPVAAINSISIYRRGHPLSLDMRSRVMSCLQQGMSSKQVAKELRVSTRTVARYRKLANEQHLPVPVARPRGGFRSSLTLMNRQQILALAEVLLKAPKLTMRELRQRAVQMNILDENKVPSETTIWRAIKKLNIDWKKATYVDPKGIALPVISEAAAIAAPLGPEGRIQDPGATAISQERAAWRFVQRLGTDGQLNPYNLLFMDESNFRLYDQQHYVWTQAQKRGVLLRPKGISPTFNVIATIGVENDTPGGMFVHYIVIPPRRDFRGVPKRFKAYEFRHPKAGIDIGYSVNQIKHQLSLEQLQQIMKEEQLRIPPGFVAAADADALERELRRILTQVRTQGKVGLYRALPERQAYLGGSIKAFRSTAVDVVDYVEQLLIPWYVKRKLHGLATECDEDSDGIIGCPDSGHHFSVPYIEPKPVTRLNLTQQLQQLQRRWQRATQRLAVYRRSNKSRTDAGQSYLQRAVETVQNLDRQVTAARDAVTRYERQLARSGSYVPFQNEIAGIGYRAKLAKKLLIWDGASSHGPIKLTSARRKSFWHEYANQVGLGGVIFLPPRSPTLNPIELLFGFLKHQIRKNCPDTGYTSGGLIKAIHDAFRLVRPQMIRNWVKKAGYRFTTVKQGGDRRVAAEDLDNEQNAVEVEPHFGVVDMEIDRPDRQAEPVRIEDDEYKEPAHPEPAAAAPAADHPAVALDLPDSEEPSLVGRERIPACFSAPGKRFPRKASFLCMDEQGSVKRRKLRGHLRFDANFDKKLNPNWTTNLQLVDVARDVEQMKLFDVHTAPAPTSLVEAFDAVGVTQRWSGLGPEPPGLSSQRPQSVAKGEDEGLWEIDGIVDHRRHHGKDQYLVRYKGYNEDADEWLGEAELDNAVGAIKEFWARVGRKN